MASKKLTMTYGQHDERSTFLKRCALVIYFVLAYLISWLLWLPLIVSKGGGLGLLSFSMSSDTSALDVLSVILLGSCGPAIAAFIMSAIVEGKAGVFLLLRRMIRVRVGIQWYMLAFFLPIVASLVYYLPLGPLDLLKHLFSTQGALGLVLYIVAVPGDMVLGSPLGEEVGWRGFALHRLQKRMGPVVGSLILALLWACWHLPLAAFTVWGAQFRVVGLLPGFMLYILTVAGYTIVMTWLFNHTRGSVFLAILFHSAVDTVPTLFFLAYPQLNTSLGVTGASRNASMSAILVSLANAGTWLVIAGIILVMTKGKLSYKHSLEKDVQPVSRRS